MAIRRPVTESRLDVDSPGSNDSSKGWSRKDEDRSKDLVRLDCCCVRKTRKTLILSPSTTKSISSASLSRSFRASLTEFLPLVLRFLELKAWLTCLRTHPNLLRSEPSLWEESQWSSSWLRSDLPCPYPLGTGRLCQSMLYERLRRKWPVPKGTILAVTAFSLIRWGDQWRQMSIGDGRSRLGSVAGRHPIYPSKPVGSELRMNGWLLPGRWSCLGGATETPTLRTHHTR